jgi:hypothetical protein
MPSWSLLQGRTFAHQLWSGRSTWRTLERKRKILYEANRGNSLSPPQTDRPLHVSRGGERGKVVELSGKTRIAPPGRTSVPWGISVTETDAADAFVAATGYNRKYAMWLLNHAKEVQFTSHTNSQSVVERMVASLVFIPSPNLFLNRLRPILQHINRTATCVWKLLPRRSCLFRAPFTALGISLRLEHRQRDRTFRARRVVRVVRAPLPAFSPRGG